MLREAGNVTLVRAVHLAKALDPIAVRLVGKVMLARDVQSRNTTGSIESRRVFDKFILKRDVHWLNASSPIEVREFGKVMLARDVQMAKAPAPIDVIVSGNMTLTIFVRSLKTVDNGLT